MTSAETAPNSEEPGKGKRFQTARLARITVARLLPSLGRFNVGLLVVALVVGGVLPVALSLFTGALIGSVPGAVGGGFDSAAGRVLVAALAAVAIVYLVQQIIGPLQGAIAETMGRRLDGKIRERVMRAVLEPEGISHLEDPHLQDEISQARGVGGGGYTRGGFTPGGAVSGLVLVASRYLQTVLFAGVLLTFRWWVPVVLVPLHLVIRRFGRREFLKMVEIYSGQTQDLRRSQYFVGLGIGAGGAKEARSFGLRQWIRERYSAYWLPVIERVWRQRAMSVKRVFPLGLVLWPAQLVIYVVIVSAALDGGIGIGALTVYLIAMTGIAAVGTLGNEDVAVELGMSSVPAVLRLEEVTSSARLSLGIKDPKGLPRQGIRFEGVRFGYPGGGHEVFSGLDLEIPAGTSLALVGANGAGKTTLVKLLCRLYDPTEGRITVDGIDLRDFDPRAWQERVAAIFQDFVRYELTARENVAWGIEDGHEGRIAEAARKAGAISLIEKLPHEWDTILSRRYTDGVDLSGGEWQRVALARALHAAAARPGVLVLDEPTANLDVRAEAEIYGRFLELTGGLTTILISHRFSTVRGADRICVVDNGKVIEQGTHGELVALGGKYSEMFNLQAARFVSRDPHA